MDNEKYVVKDGDTEFSLSQKLGVSVGALRRANTMFPTFYIKVGRKINIPH